VFVIQFVDKVQAAAKTYGCSRGAGGLQHLSRFQPRTVVAGYAGVMLLLGVHLRHGVWSAFQSLGATKPRLTPLIYLIGAVLALAIAVGFLILPLWIYFTGGNA
jgi:hypothetical protein